MANAAIPLKSDAFSGIAVYKYYANILTLLAPNDELANRDHRWICTVLAIVSITSTVTN